MKALTRILPVILVLTLSASGLATVIEQDTGFGSYLLEATATPLGGDSWRFDYAITNLQSPHTVYGSLDGFFIQIPQSATNIVPTVPPPPPGGSGYWTFGITDPAGWVGYVDLYTPWLPGYDWYVWWGQSPAATYGPGLTAYFSLEIDNVFVGQSPAILVNYISGVATTYTDPYAILAPAEVPEPLTLSLLAMGALSLIVGRKHK